MVALFRFEHVPRRKVGAVVAAWLGFAVVVTAAMLVWGYETRRLYTEQAMETTRGLTETYKAYTEKAIEEIDYSLELVAAYARQHGKLGPRLLQAVLPMLELGRLHTSYVSNQVIVNAGGSVVGATSAAKSAIGLDATARDFYLVHRDGLAEKFYVGRVIESKVRPGEWRLSVSRRLQGPKGEFLGVVVALVDVELLAREYARHLSDPSASVTLMYLDGTVMSRTPYVADQIGKVLPSFARYKGNPPSKNSFIIRSQVDQVTRLIAQRRFDHMPLLVAVTLLEDAALARWRATLAPLGLLWGVILLVTAIVAVFVLRQMGRREIALEALRASEERFDLATKGSSDGFWDWNVVTGEDYFSDRFCQMLGYGRDELRPHVDTWRDMLHPDDQAATWRALQAHLERRGLYDVEIRMRAKSGEYRWFRARGQAVWNESGQAVRMAGSIVDITDRVRAQEQARASLREKEVLLKEIYHRVKNNLQVVSSLLGMQSDGVGPEASALLLDSAQRVKSMALVHEQLYQSGDLSSIHFREYAERLLENLRGAHGEVAQRVSVRTEVDDLHLDIETAIPLGLVINELISNCYKHAYPQGRGGQVEFSLRAVDDGALELTVSDDGVGLPVGFDPAKLKTLGMQLVTSLAAQLGGTLAYGRNGAQGARFDLRFRPDAQDYKRLEPLA